MSLPHASAIAPAQQQISGLSLAPAIPPWQQQCGRGVGSPTICSSNRRGPGSYQRCVGTSGSALHCTPGLCHPATMPPCLPALQPPGQASQPRCCFHSESHPSRRWQHSKATSAPAVTTCMPATCLAASTSCSRCSCPSGCSRQQCPQKRLRRWAGRQTRECPLSRAASGLEKHPAVGSEQTFCLLCCTRPQSSSQGASQELR